MSSTYKPTYNVMAHMALYDDSETKTKEVEVQGSGEIEFHFNDQATANVSVDWSKQSVVIKPSAKASIGVFAQGTLEISGGTSLVVLERDIGTHAAVSLSFSSKTHLGITHQHNQDGHQVGFKLSVRL